MISGRQSYFSSPHEAKDIVNEKNHDRRPIIESSHEPLGALDLLTPHRTQKNVLISTMGCAEQHKTSGSWLTTLHI